MHYFSYNFLKIAKRRGSRSQRRLTIDFSYLKLGDLPKLCFLKLIMMNQAFKKAVMTSFE